MTKEMTNYKADLLADLAVPGYAAQYAATALQDSPSVFLLALRDIAESQTMSKVAQSAELNRESLYRMLSPSGNPRLSSLVAVLNTLGLRLTIEADHPIVSAGRIDTKEPGQLLRAVGRRRFTKSTSTGRNRRETRRR
jgi:probable addiction module antidote protein